MHVKESLLPLLFPDWELALVLGRPRVRAWAAPALLQSVVSEQVAIRQRLELDAALLVWLPLVSGISNPVAELLPRLCPLL